MIVIMEGFLGQWSCDPIASNPVPVFHVCQECGGDGCRDCGSYGIVEGDIPDLELDLSIPFSAELELDFNTESGSAQ